MYKQSDLKRCILHCPAVETQNTAMQILLSNQDAGDQAQPDR